MYKFGGNTFIDCCVPLALEGRYWRYFIVEPGNPPSFNVVLEHNGKLIFEIKKNKPYDNPITKLSMTGVGIIAVSDKVTDRFLYKFRPENETSIVLGKIDGGETSVKITDRETIVNGAIIRGNTFIGKVGITVRENGGFSIGNTPIPESVQSIFKK